MRKKAFTLIELIGVIIILGVIGLIVYPVVNKSIKQSKENALKETIRNIEKAGEMYSVKNDIGYSESYNNLDIQVLKDSGLIKNSDLINPMTDEKLEGCLLYRWVNKQYEFKYTEPCVQTPQITLNNKDGVFNDKGWSISPFYVSVNSNTETYEYCVSDKECVPDTIVNNSSGEVYINQNGDYYVCVKAINEIGSSEVICEQYKLDTSAPVIASNVVYFDKGDNRLTDLLDITSASGYKVDCDKQKVSELEIGSNTVSCTITSNNGLSTTNNINFVINNLRKVIIWNETTFLGSTTLKEKVESIKFLDYIKIPDNVVEVVDVSEQQNGSIMAWYVDNDNNGMYELYIGQNGGVIANRESNNLFINFTQTTVMDVNALDTTSVTDMGNMFSGMNSLTRLNVSNFDTSKVTSMYSMFSRMDSILQLDLSSFDTSQVKSMSYMFYQNSVIDLNISNFDTSNVTSMYSMFQRMPNIRELDLTNFDTSKVTDMNNMFFEIRSLTSLNINSFDTSNVTNMNRMFGGLRDIDNLDLSHFDTSKVTNMSGMFAGAQFKNIDTSRFDTSNVKNMESMFRGTSQTTIDLSNFDTSSVTNMKNMFSIITH